MKQIKWMICYVPLFQKFLACVCHPPNVFTTLTMENVTLVPLTWNWTEPNAVSCARNCLLTYRSCYSFIYSKLTRRCISGSWLIPSHQSRDIHSGDLYTKGAFCGKNFTVKTENGFAACLRVFKNKVNYTSARSHCKDIGAELYTMKSFEKKSILHNEVIAINESVWIGLDDLKTEGRFEWADDGTPLDADMKIKMFTKGEPNNYDDEDCVSYTPSAGLDDRSCSFKKPYVCELKPISLV
ncbi:unnamed protein product [Lymnaea stagnalis]|uniref:C-type lectin domain-containing protein n=1 Tax=Lymnaea stagnalis TaxID=6523 RepID=A0AAV2GYB5_LYMST